MILRLATDAAATLEANCIHEWKRGDIPTLVMSTSSGPKDYLKNQIFVAFDADRSVDRIRLMKGQFINSPLFILLHRAEGWFDVSNGLVIVENDHAD